MSLCIALPARARGPIALLCILCVFSKLLLIFNVESALSVLATASVAVGACCLPGRGARRFVVSCRGVSDSWTARWAAMSAMLGIVDG